MHVRLATHAFESVLKSEVATPRALSGGRTSAAFIAEIGHGRWIARIPLANSRRLPSYKSEQLIGERLAEQGCRVAEWTVVTVDGVACSVARALPGQPVEYGADWSADFVASIANVLHALHHLPVTGFGPLENTSGELRG